MSEATNDGLIYGLNSLSVGEKEIGMIDENGLQPAGSAATMQEIYAAQVKDGPVKSIVSKPAKRAFKCNIIQLKADNLIDVVGGSKDATTGAWTPPEDWSVEGVVTIKCDSGHTIKINNAKITADDFANGINSQNVLALALNIDCNRPADTAKKRIEIIPPQTTVG